VVTKSRFDCNYW